MVLNLKVTDRKEGKMVFRVAALESFCKAFLLPLDCLIGWLAMPNNKLRLFNRISNTIVIRTKYEEPEEVRYVKEKESFWFYGVPSSTLRRYRSLSLSGAYNSG